jgi:hypothetical protein
VNRLSEEFSKGITLILTQWTESYNLSPFLVSCKVYISFMYNKEGKMRRIRQQAEVLSNQSSGQGN